MAIEIVMPRVDMDMTSGRMGRWHAAEGAHVDKGQTLFEIETDKAAMEVDAPASGVLKFVAASEGDVLPVGTCIGWIVAEGESFAPPVANAPPLPERDNVGSARSARAHPEKGSPGAASERPHSPEGVPEDARLSTG
ncbi:MAG: biotin/lipoyl-containing protein, partial [Roseiarcus sp.]